MAAVFISKNNRVSLNAKLQQACVAVPVPGADQVGVGAL